MKAIAPFRCLYSADGGNSSGIAMDVTELTTVGFIAKVSGSLSGKLYMAASQNGDMWVKVGSDIELNSKNGVIAFAAGYAFALIRLVWEKVDGAGEVEVWGNAK